MHTNSENTLKKENSMLSITEPGHGLVSNRTIIQIQKPAIYRDFTRNNLLFTKDMMNLPNKSKTTGSPTTNNGVSNNLLKHPSVMQMISPLSKKLLYRNLHTSNVSLDHSQVTPNSPGEDDKSEEELSPSEKLNFDLNTAKKRSWLSFVKKQIDEMKAKPEFEYLIHLETENRDVVEAVLSEKIHKQNTTFYKFLWDRDGHGDKLADRFISLILMYVSDLIRLERLKLTHELRSNTALPKVLSGSSVDLYSPKIHSPQKNVSYGKKGKSPLSRNTRSLSPSKMRSPSTLNKSSSQKSNNVGKDNLIQEILSQKKRAYDHLVQLSFTYSLVLQRYRFDTGKEKRFFETLYSVTAKIVCSRFENQALHPVIEAEIAKLFRSEHFFVPQKDRTELQYFVSGEELYNSHKLNRNGSSFMKSKIAFSKELSPLMGNVFPVDETKVDEFIENIRLDIPPECLLLETSARKKDIHRSLVAELEEEVSTGEMNLRDATMVQLQLKVLYELEATTRSAKHARELMEKSMT